MSFLRVAYKSYISGQACFFETESTFLFFVRRLGTPNDRLWPGVTTLKDFKPVFPKWLAKDFDEIVPSMDSIGHGLLKVKWFLIQQNIFLRIRCNLEMFSI